MQTFHNLFIKMIFSFPTGVPAAMISINVIEHLCKLLVSTAEQVRGSAAIALGYLSYNHTGERQLLNKWVKKKKTPKIWPSNNYIEQVKNQ